MRFDTLRVHVVLAFAAAAALWPAALCALSDAMATPLQRALSTSWCGAGPQSVEFLGHCPACWAGAVGLLAAAAISVAFPSWRGRRHRTAAP